MPKLTQGMYRLGTETAFDVLARAEQLKSEGRDIINLGIGQPDFKTPPHIVEAAIKALRDGQHGYTPGNGIKPLREAVAVDLERRYSIGINPDHVVVVPGGKVTMFFAILMFGEPGAEILYPNPGFPIYESMINYTGAKPVAIPLLEKNCYTFDANAVLKLITSNTRLIILNTPSNPTGSYVPKEQLNKLAEGLEAHASAREGMWCIRRLEATHGAVALAALVVLPAGAGTHVGQNPMAQVHLDARRQVRPGRDEAAR